MHKRTFSTILALGLAVSLFGLAGCSSKKQTTPPPAQPTTQTTPTRPTTPRVEPRQPETVEESVPRDLAFTTIYFDFDESSIRSDQRSAMEKNAQLLNQYKSVTIRIEGHCDERGTEEYNMALGQRRAAAVQQFLTNYGIASSRVTTISYGEMRPAVSGQSESAWSRNRRCEIAITGR